MVISLCLQGAWDKKKKKREKNVTMSQNLMWFILHHFNMARCCQIKQNGFCLFILCSIHFQPFICAIMSRRLLCSLAHVTPTIQKLHGAIMQPCSQACRRLQCRSHSLCGPLLFYFHFQETVFFLGKYSQALFFVCLSALDLLPLQ